MTYLLIIFPNSRKEKKYIHVLIFSAVSSSHFITDDNGYLKLSLNIFPIPHLAAAGTALPPPGIPQRDSIPPSKACDLAPLFSLGQKGEYVKSAGQLILIIVNSPVCYSWFVRSSSMK